MTVVGLHPEELFDKLVEGELTQVERERLVAHLDGCEVCRFEYAARADFYEEALALDASSSPPTFPPRAPHITFVKPRRRRRSRAFVWGISAAALISASGAVASVVVGTAPWHAASLLFSPALSPSAGPTRAAPKQVTPRRSRCVGDDCSAAGLLHEPTSLVEPKTASAGPEPSELAEPRQVRQREPRAVSHSVARSPAPKLVKEAASLAPSQAEPEAPVAREPATAGRLFGEANQARRSGDIGRAARLYHLLQDQFAGSAEAELSRVTLSLLLLDSGDSRGALVGFERYLAGASRGLEVEALVGRARALGRLGRRDLETSAWQEVQRKYPRSIYGRQATERLLALGLP